MRKDTSAWFLTFFVESREENSFVLSFKSQLFRTFASDMKLSDKWTNVFLAVLAIVLLALCVRSVVHERQSANKQQELRDGGNHKSAQTADYSAGPEHHGDAPAER